MECANCAGYRLLWDRWIIGVVRGNRKRLVIKQLSWKTSVAGGGGVPLNGVDCDACCLPHMGNGVINLTDGADAYEAFADGEIVCSPACERTDCLNRAAANGGVECCGRRPRTGRARFNDHYKQLHLSHGIVTHNKQEWSLVKAVQLFDHNGAVESVELKHGTQVADGAWAEVRQSIPAAVHSRDHDRIAEYVQSWAWRARRHGQDLFVALGAQLRQ